MVLDSLHARVSQVDLEVAVRLADLASAYTAPKSVELPVLSSCSESLHLSIFYILWKTSSLCSMDPLTFQKNGQLEE